MNKKKIKNNLKKNDELIDKLYSYVDGSIEDLKAYTEHILPKLEFEGDKARVFTIFTRENAFDIEKSEFLFELSYLGGESFFFPERIEKFHVGDYFLSNKGNWYRADGYKRFSNKLKFKKINLNKEAPVLHKILEELFILEIERRMIYPDSLEGNTSPVEIEEIKEEITEELVVE